MKKNKKLLSNSQIYTNKKSQQIFNGTLIQEISLSNYVAKSDDRAGQRTPLVNISIAVD